jgi:predicted Zn-dependent protease
LGVAYVPARDDVVLAEVAVRARAAAPVVTEAEAAQRAKELVLEARARGGDPRLLGQVQAVLSKWWTGAASPDVLLMRATVKQSLHDFEGALGDLDALLAVRGDDVQGWLTRATVLTVMGRYADARKSCTSLSPSPPPGERVGERGKSLLQTICEATPRALSGELQSVLLDLQSVTPPDAATRAWVDSVRGELERWSGDEVSAEKSLRAALTADPSDAYTRLLLGELLLDTKREQEVAALYAGRTLNDTELLLVVLAGGTDAQREDLTERVAANRQRGETLHRREESRYALRVEGDAAKALELAVENWKVQREPADARVLLEAAAAAKNVGAAEPALKWLGETKLPWPVLHAKAKELGRE